MPTLVPGFLFSCTYLFWKHDPSPLVLVSKVYSDGRVAGVNLHYLTFPVFRSLVQHYCGKPGFSYDAIKGDTFIASAFRTYKQQGLRNIKGLDCRQLLPLLGKLRSFDPNEIEAMRQEVQKQLQQEVNMPVGKARSLADRPSSTIPPIPGKPATVPPT